MNCTIRLYWQHDLDLIALAMHPDFVMSNWLKRAVIAWARGDKHFRIPLPINPQPSNTELLSTVIHFRLDPVKEADVIEKVLSIRNGFRNTAVKILFREFLIEQNMEPFFNTALYDVKQLSFLGNTSRKKTDQKAKKENPYARKGKTRNAPLPPQKSETFKMVNTDISNKEADSKQEVLVNQGTHNEKGPIIPKKDLIPNPDTLQPISSEPIETSINNSTVLAEESYEYATDNTSDDFDLFGTLGTMIGDY